MKKFIFLFVMLWLSVSTAKSVDTNCLLELPRHFTIFMSDGDSITTKVFIDTCGLTDLSGDPIELDSLLEYDAIFNLEKRKYAKEAYRMRFPAFPFDTTGKNLDTITYLTIDDIKQKYSEIKDSLLSIIKSTTGEMRFYRFDDKSKTYSHNIHAMFQTEFWTTFENLVNVYEVEEIIDSYDGINFEFMSEYDHPTNSIFEQNDKIEIYPNPASAVIKVEYPYNASSIKVTSLNGETLKEFSRTEIAQMNSNGSISVKTVDFTPGVYFVIIDNQYFEKLIIQP